MTTVHRILYPEPISTLDDYRRARGGLGLEVASAADPDAIIDMISQSGLRGRGGAGFPTGRKWRTVRDSRSPVEPTSVVVNGAEGEPGTFKDRTILRNDPYQVLEGAIIAARAVEASEIIFGLKESFQVEVRSLRAAIDEVRAAGWLDGLAVSIFEGPHEYLYGEETALLETIDGRYPLPRIAPPYRRGVTEVVEAESDVASGVGLSAHVEMAAPGGTTAPPALVDNVETVANVARILARGPAWFRTMGTLESPGTIVCTVTGATERAGVGEVPMGTPLREVIEVVGGGPRPGHEIKVVVPGVSAGVVPAARLDTPVSYEAMAAIGSGLGSAGFIVFDDEADMVAVAAGISRFLAVESCGQCTPCKQDGLAIARSLEGLSRSAGRARDLEEIEARLTTVSDEARCYLALQHQAVVASIVQAFHDDFEQHVRQVAAPADPELIAELINIDGGAAVIDERHRAKQPDWTYNADDSGEAPAERFAERRARSDLDD